MPKMFFPQYMKGREGTELTIGESILEHIRRIGRVEIDSECGGQGICGMDIVRIEEGSECLTEMTDAERVTAIIEHTKPNEIEGEEFAYMVAMNMYFNEEMLKGE